MEATELVNKYLVALQELYNVLGYTKRISLTDFCNKHNLNIKTTKVLVSGGIVKRSGTRRLPEYTWETIKPNIHMAEELTKKLKKQNKVDNGSKENKKSKSKVVTKEIAKALTLNYKITYLFFGLIKIKTQYFYEQ